MHYARVKSILSAKNGMNLYRGCSHGCIYCDSRSKCYQMKHDFEDIEVKENAIELLEQALLKKRSKCMLGTGSMTDPYIPLEKTLEYTRKTMELALKYNFGITVITKSNLILRDLELLQKIHQQSKAVVQMTLTTYDEKLCKILEPNVCTTKERFEVLLKCREMKIPTIVWFDPILPFINDTEENLRGILKYCIEARVYGIMFFGFGVTLREGDREYFYQKLDENFPGIKEKYIRKYGNSYIVTSQHNSKLYKIFKEECDKNYIITDPNLLFKYLDHYPIKYQKISLFD